MIPDLVKLIILFFVIFDPFASLIVFFVATKEMEYKQKVKTACLAIGVALGLSYLVLLLGNNLLEIFNTSLQDFKVAGGIILGILGVQMALGASIGKLEKHENNSSSAIAALIGTPWLTGPAAITTIIITVKDYGTIMTGSAVTIVLLGTGLMFYLAEKLNKFMGITPIQIMSSIFGLITVAWAIRFIREGLGI